MQIRLHGSELSKCIIKLAHEQDETKFSDCLFTPGTVEMKRSSQSL